MLVNLIILDFFASFFLWLERHKGIGRGHDLRLCAGNILDVNTAVQLKGYHDHD